MPDRELDADLSADLAELAANTRALTAYAARVVPNAEAEARRGRLTRILLAVVAVALVAVAVFGALFFRSEQDSDRAFQDGLCPILFRVASNYMPDRFPPGPERDRYDDDIRQIVVSYHALGCRGPLVSPVPNR